MVVLDSVQIAEGVKSGKVALSVIGLGYVGIPLAVAFSKYTHIIGYDTCLDKIDSYQKGRDVTNEVGDEAIRGANILFTGDASHLRQAGFHIIAVPTPINPDKTPDLSPLIAASETLGKNLRPGSVIVYESTVYPSVTEDVCVPVLERNSGLTCGEDFFVGYSPERINPGDKHNRLETIRKIVSGMDAETLDAVADVYSLVIKAGVHRAPTIKVAEAAKVAENSQRDINIAIVNEFAHIFARMGVDTHAVIDAMDTKWNALGFRPGLVGGHCIGVDPYYLTYQAERLGYNSHLIDISREINDGMGCYVADNTIQQMVLAGCNPCNARVAILGVTFKENCNDIRNTRVMDIYTSLGRYGIKPLLHDPIADARQFEAEYGVTMSDWDALTALDCIIIAVAHDCFCALDEGVLARLYGRTEGRLLVDVKGIFRNRSLDKSFVQWRL